MYFSDSNLPASMRTGGEAPNPPRHPLNLPRNHKRSPIPGESHNYRRKKRRFISKSESETLALSKIRPSESTRYLTTSNWRFREHRYDHTYGKYRKRRSRKSGSQKWVREWAYSTRDSSNFVDKVVLVSYNILGVENASKHPYLYHNVSPKYMDWDHRKKLICEELSHYNPGIICFQEVDCFDDLDNLLQKNGFRGVYLARTGDAHDGCAIFWKSKLFSLAHQENIKFQSFGLCNNVAQLCVFEMIQNLSKANVKNETSGVQSSQRLLVGNIHVLFNPKRGDIKLGQIQLFLEKAHKLSHEWGSIPVVLSGDLNSLPQSAIYHFLASSELDLQQYDRRNISGQICPLDYSSYQSQIKEATSSTFHRWSNEELRLATGCEGVTQLRHKLELCSVYAGVPGSLRTRDSCAEPLATSYHSKFLGTVDYIWHTKDLVPVRVLETLPVDILKKTGGLPNKKWGSDHLALVCELAFIKNGG